MKICSNCNARFEDDVLFCDECGMKLEEEAAAENLYCPECGTQNEAESEFCHNCGCSLREKEETVNVFSKHSPAKKKKKYWVTGGLALVAVLAVGAGAVIVPKLLPKKEPENFLYYAKENELYHYDGKKSIKISDELIDKRAGSNYYDSEGIKYSEDGRYIYFLDEVESEYSGGTLRRVDLKKQSDKKDTSEKIASGVARFSLLNKDQVYYVKQNIFDYSKTLHYWSPDREEKIASNMMVYYVNQEGTQVLWQDTDENLYYTDLKKNVKKEKLASGVTIFSVSDDLKTIYYMDRKSGIYALKSFEEEKIASDTMYIGKYGDGKGIYYLEKKKAPLAIDYLDDDMAAEDAAMRKPRESDYQKLVSNYWNYYYQTDHEAYNRAWERYREKQNRDEIRNTLKDTSLSYSYGDLYLYDGKEKRLILENAVYARDFDYTLSDQEGAVIVYSLDNLNLEPIRISELDNNAYRFIDLLEEKAFAKSEEGIAAFMIVGGEAFPIKYDCHNLYIVDTDNHLLYSLEGADYALYDCEDLSDLNRMYSSLEEIWRTPYSTSGLGDRVLLDDDASGSFRYMGFEKHFFYIKDNKIYCDGEKVSREDVYNMDVLDGRFMIYTDYRDSNYTLLEWKNGELTELAEDVYTYAPFGKDSLACLIDYRTDRREGALYIIKNGKEERIDDDVTWIGTSKKEELNNARY